MTVTRRLYAWWSGTGGLPSCRACTVACAIGSVGSRALGMLCVQLYRPARHGGSPAASISFTSSTATIAFIASTASTASTTSNYLRHRHRHRHLPTGQVQRWLSRVFGRTVLNGYGCTETGGLTSNGAIADGVELRLRDLCL
jgi:hypothetical protein